MKLFLCTIFFILISLQEIHSQVFADWDSLPKYENLGIDFSSNVVADGNGNVYVAGSIKEATTTDKDWIILKYDAYGELANGWPMTFPNTGNDSICTMKIDAFGNLYLTGKYSFPSGGGGRQSEYYTMKIKGSTQDIFWSRRFSLKLAAGFDQPNGMDIDKDGNVYVTGESEKDNTNQFLNLVVIKYANTSSGIDEDTYEWKYEYDGGNGSDGGTAIKVTQNGDIFVGGYSSGAGTSFDFLTIKLNSIGEFQWKQSYDGTIHLIDKIIGLVVDSNNGVIITGTSQASTGNDFRTINYSNSGTTTWSKGYNYFAKDEPYKITIDKFNSIYILGKSFRGDQKENIFLIKYNGSTGDTLWTKSINGGLPNGNNNSYDAGTSIFVGSDSAIYVSGYVVDYSLSGYAKNFILLKLNYTNGSEIWRIRFDSTNTKNEIPYDIFVDNSTSIYITGTKEVDSLNTDIIVQKFVQTTSIAGQVFDDLDGDTLTKSDQYPYPNFTLRRYSTNGQFLDSTITDAFGFYSFIKLGTASSTFDIECDSIFPSSYAVLAGNGGVSQQSIGTRTIRVNIDFNLQKGISLSNNFYNLRDPKYCSVPQESLVIGKAVKYKSGKTPKSKPNWINIRDTVWVKANLSATSGLFIGIQQPIPNTTYGYVWIEKKYKNGISKVKNASNVTKFLPDSKTILKGEHRGSPASAKTFQIYGEKPWTTTKNNGMQKNPKYKKHMNHLVGELIALRFGIMASDLKVTPEGFGDLIFFDSTDVSIIYNGNSVYEIANIIDTALTYFDSTFDLNLLDSIASKINTAFKGATDTISSTPLKVFGNVRLKEIPFMEKAQTGNTKQRTKYENDNLSLFVSSYMLNQNYPNPFNPKTKISFEFSEPSFTNLKIYNVLGQEVFNFFENKFFEEGNYNIEFNGENLSSGIYFYRLFGENENQEKFSFSKKMLLLK